jgi:hypothetical protein
MFVTVVEYRCSGDVRVGLEDGLDDVALDKLAFSARAAANGVVSDVAQGAGCGFVEDGDGVGGEELLGSGEARADVVGRVIGARGSMVKR